MEDGGLQVIKVWFQIFRNYYSLYSITWAGEILNMSRHIHH